MRTLESQLAATILSCYPTAASFRRASVKKLAGIVYDGSHKIGEELARALIEAAANSVGIRGCASITNVFGPRANLARSLLSQRCESC